MLSAAIDDRTLAVHDFTDTVILESVPFRTESVVEPIDETPFPIADEPPAPRLEEKLDAAIRMIAAMQQRLDSLDATLMRVLMR